VNIDLCGQRFGRLVVQRRKGSDKHQHALWECLCDCGKNCVKTTGTLRVGDARSCGCYNIDVCRQRFMKHGGVGTVEYAAWMNMVSRCCTPTHPSYRRYGGRGIRVCESWRHDFMAFLRSVGKRPNAQVTLERKDNEGNYEPGNVCWATHAEQSRNKRNNVRITFDGRTQCLTDWAKETGINVNTLGARLHRLGWSVKEALSTPAQKRSSCYV
jgi:hypothetical protein